MPSPRRGEGKSVFQPEGVGEGARSISTAGNPLTPTLYPNGGEGAHRVRGTFKMSPPYPSFAFRVAVFYAALFVALGVQVPFLPLWLAAKGLDPGAIGVVLSLPMIVRVFAIPLATHAADRRDALHTVIVIASAVAILGYGVLGLAQGAVAITLAYTLASAFFTPLLPLADAYALRGLGHIGRAYGPVRMWGSAAFIVGTFGAGLLLDFIATRDLIWVMVITLAISAAAALALSPLTLHDASAGKRLPFARDLLRDPVLLAAAATAPARTAIFMLVLSVLRRLPGRTGAALTQCLKIKCGINVVQGLRSRGTCLRQYPRCTEFRGARNTRLMASRRASLNAFQARSLLIGFCPALRKRDAAHARCAQPHSAGAGGWTRLASS